MSVCICVVLATGANSRVLAEADQDAQQRLAAHARAVAAGELAKADTIASQGVKEHPQHGGLWLAFVDTALARANPTTALQRVAAAREALGDEPELAWRAGRAYADLGRWVGKTERRRLPEAQLGQFVAGKLVVRHLDRRGTVLLSGADGAVHALRLALEGGIDRAEVHLLYARCWVSLGAMDEAVAIVRRQLEALAEVSDPDLAAQAQTLAVEAGDLTLLLDAAKIRAQKAGKSAAGVLANAHDQAADIAALRGEIELTYSLRKRAFELQPDVHGRRLRLADSAWDAGDQAIAARHYRAILVAEPHHPSAKRMRERLASVDGPN